MINIIDTTPQTSRHYLDQEVQLSRVVGSSDNLLGSQTSSEPFRPRVLPLVGLLGVWLSLPFDSLVSLGLLFNLVRVILLVLLNEFTAVEVAQWFPGVVVRVVPACVSH